MVKSGGIGLYEEQWEQLGEIAVLRETSVSHIVRRLLRKHLPGELAAARAEGAVAPAEDVPNLSLKSS